MDQSDTISENNIVIKFLYFIDLHPFRKAGAKVLLVSFSNYL